MSTAIWQGEEMGLFDALSISLSGIATVFMALIALALAIIITTKIIAALGLNKIKEKEVKATKTASTMPASANASTNAVKAPVEEDMEEYAVILAAVSEHTRVPIERLRIKSITKK